MKKHCVALYGSWVVPLVARTSVGTLLYILLLNTTLNPYLLTGDLRDHSAFGDIVAAAQPLRSRWALEMADRALPGNPWALEMDASAHCPGAAGRSKWLLRHCIRLRLATYFLSVVWIGSRIKKGIGSRVELRKAISDLFCAFNFLKIGFSSARVSRWARAGRSGSVVENSDKQVQTLNQKLFKLGGRTSQQVHQLNSLPANRLTSQQVNQLTD